MQILYFYLKGVKIINISTMSAYNGCKSIYGQNKLKIEKYIENNYGYNLRMGVPINAVNKKSIGFLNTQKKINNLLPFFTFAINTKNDGLIYLSYLPKFNRIIYKIICGRIPSGTFSIVRIKPIKLLDFIATYTNKYIIKIDWRLIYLLLKFIEALGLNLRFGSDSVIGLVKATRHLEKPLLK